MRWLFSSFYILSFFFSFEVFSCEKDLGGFSARFRRDVVEKPFDFEAYEKAHLGWKSWVEDRGGVNALPGFTDELFTRLQSGDGSLETLLAVGDAIRPDSINSVSFRDQISRIHRWGAKVILRTYRFPYRPKWNLMGWKKRKITVDAEQRGWFRKGMLTLFHPGVAPDSPSELVDSLYSVALYLNHFRLVQVASKAPLLRSHPVVKEYSPHSFPYQVRRALVEAEVQLYSLIYSLENLFPENSIPLKKKDRNWRWPRIEAALEVPLRLLFPRYNPLSRYQPNRGDYQEYLNDLEEGWDGKTDSPFQVIPERYPSLSQSIFGKYTLRTRQKWAIDHYRRGYLAILITAAVSGILEIVEVFRSGEWVTYMDKARELQEKAKDTERLNKNLDAYQKRPGGDPVVVRHYNAKIRALQVKIQLEGDPDGKLTEEIKKLIDRRDRLKN